MATITPHNNPASPHPDHPHSQTREPSIQSVPRRGSAHSIKQALTSRGRANSMVGRRFSRAESQHFGPALGQDGPTLIGGSADGYDPQFDLSDLSEFANLSEYKFDSFPYGFEENVAVNGQVNNGHVGNIDMPATNDYGYGANYPKVPIFDQFTGERLPQPAQQYGQPLPDFNYGSLIDPAFLSQQPQAQLPYSFVDSTPGLAAVPGAANLVPTSLMPPMGSNYPLDLSMTTSHPFGRPYYGQTQAYQQVGYSPMEQPDIQQLTQDKPVPISTSNKRNHSVSFSESEDDAPVSKRQRFTRPVQDLSDDESDSHLSEGVKVSRLCKPVCDRRESRDSTGSSNGSSLGKLKKPPIVHAGQKPQKSEDKPWIRINNNTKGETTRTARINNAAQSERKYKYKPLPHVDSKWRTGSGKYSFEYTSNSGLDEFRKKKMSARQIMAYIMEYPSDALRLWIQVSPADMARRYGSPGHSKCLFENCPKHVWGDSGTIDVGHYRVAFDEKFKAHGNKIVDPFDCAGFVHLYCLERFCDFERICRKADVQVDTRVDLPREIGQAKWTMSGRPEMEQAQYFIKACKKDKLRHTETFAQYPVHISSSAPKQFDRTLVHALVDINVASRTRSQMRQFLDRKLTPNILMINKGDMELAMTQKKIKHSNTYRRVSKKKKHIDANFNFDFEARYDEYDPVINERIQHYRNLKAQFDHEDATGIAAHKPRPSGKRKAAIDDHHSGSDTEPEVGPSHIDPHDDHSDTESIQELQHSPRSGTRSSPRNHQRVNYGEDEHSYVYNQTYQAPQQQQPYMSQSFVQADFIRKASLSQYLSVEGGPSLDDFEYLAHDDQPALTTDEINALMNELQRRKSSTLSRGPQRLGSIMSCRSFGRPSRAKGCVASFDAQPVSSQHEFDSNDPPSQLVATPTSTRRSERLASRSI